MPKLPGWFPSLHTRRAPDPFGLDRQVVKLSRQNDAITLRMLLAGGAVVLGDPGSSKSTAVLNTFTARLHRLGCSVVHPTVKPDDVPQFVRLAARFGGRQPFVFTPGVDTFNPLWFLQRRQDSSLDLLEPLVNLFLLPHRKESQVSGGGDAFWRLDAARFCRHIIGLYLVAGEPMSFRGIYDCLTTLPESAEEVRTAAWQQRCPIFRVARKAARKASPGAERTAARRSTQFLLGQVPRMPHRTRASTVSTAAAATDALVTGPIGDAINAETDTWDPTQLTERPGVLVIDCPIQTHGALGAMLQRLLISAVQRDVLSRNVTPDTPPVVFMADEIPSYLDLTSDIEFLRTGRSQLGTMVLAAQGIGSIQAACGDAKDPKAACEALVGTCSTKIFTATNDRATLEFAKDTFTSTPQHRISFGSSEGDGGEKDRGKKSGRNTNLSRDHLPDVHPIDIATLARGGPKCGDVAEAMCAHSGTIWRASRRPSLKVQFSQIFP